MTITSDWRRVLRILVTNDDGINSPGLWSVARALADVGEVMVAAPDRDQSGIGTAKTLLAVVRASEIPSPLEGIRAYSVEGTPSDCVILATEALGGGPFDLVVSGINQGANLGMDVLDSGTVGAAIQGYHRGIPSIAVSVASLSDLQYDAAAQTVRSLARAIAGSPLSRPILLNVNLPNVTPDRIERVEFTRLGPKAYGENVERGYDGRKTHYWIKHNKPLSASVAEGTDIWAVRNNRISITPLHPIFMNGEVAAELDSLLVEVSAGLKLSETN